MAGVYKTAEAEAATWSGRLWPAGSDVLFVEELDGGPQTSWRRIGIAFALSALPTAESKFAASPLMKFVLAESGVLELGF